MLPSQTTDQWDATSTEYQLLLSITTPFAPSLSPSLLCTKVQIATFQPPGLATIIVLIRSPANNQCLLRFVHTRSTNNLFLSSPMSLHTPSPSSIFDPLLLTVTASGSINASGPYPPLVSQADSRPLRRHKSSGFLCYFLTPLGWVLGSHTSHPISPSPSLTLLTPSNPARRILGKRRTPPLQSRM
ncbi:hypothetical protein JMJ35_003783 [Cladonia borealis]|uniref:Uncharacterized protein n=1 Tax=Cladonia borealis TaxID=184061 RepID=A0AA39UC37_9LECA|nr:hypothetical protein JMJ35_003783 [Cladonia borealis]